MQKESELQGHSFGIKRLRALFSCPHADAGGITQRCTGGKIVQIQRESGKGAEMSEVEEVVEITDEADTESKGENQPAGGSRTLTSEEHDRIVKARIDKQRAKYDRELEELKQKLAEEAAVKEAALEEAETLKQQKQLSEWASKIAKENGIPAGILRGSTEEELTEHAAQIKASVSIYPIVPSDKGDNEPITPTKEGILAIEDAKERRAAIAANLNLFT